SYVILSEMGAEVETEGLGLVVVFLGNGGGEIDDDGSHGRAPRHARADGGTDGIFVHNARARLVDVPERTVIGEDMQPHAKILGQARGELQLGRAAPEAVAAQRVHGGQVAWADACLVKAAQVGAA